MAVHYFTDGIVMPPNYQDPALYARGRRRRHRALAAGPLPTTRPTRRPTINGPVSGPAGRLTGPYTIGANAAATVTSVTGGDAFLTPPAPSRSPAARAPARHAAVAPVGSAGGGARRVRASSSDPIGTLMVGDPTYRVQSMALAGPLTLLGKNSSTVPSTRHR